MMSVLGVYKVYDEYMNVYMCVYVFVTSSLSMDTPNPTTIGDISTEFGLAHGISM